MCPFIVTLNETIPSSFTFQGNLIAQGAERVLRASFQGRPLVCAPLGLRSSQGLLLGGVWKELRPKAESGEKGYRREPQAKGQLPWHHHVWVQESKESKHSDIKLGLWSDYGVT